MRLSLLLYINSYKYDAKSPKAMKTMDFDETVVFHLSNGAMSMVTKLNVHGLPPTGTQQHTTPTMDFPNHHSYYRVPLLYLRHRQSLRCNEDTTDALPSACSTRKSSYTLLRTLGCGANTDRRILQRMHWSTSRPTAKEIFALAS